MHPAQEARSITKRRRLVDSMAGGWGPSTPGQLQRGSSASACAARRGSGGALGRGDQVKIDDIA